MIVVVGRFRHIRSPTNVLLASLAIADITVALLVMPAHLLYDLERVWRFGQLACHLWISCDVMCCTASILHICVVALDRFWAIVHPLRYRITRRKLVVTITSVWLCSAGISFVPVFLGWHDDGSVAKGTQCTLRVNASYALVSSLTSFYLPLPVMGYVYLRILLVAERQACQIRSLENSLTHEPPGLSLGLELSLRRRSRQLVADTKAVRTLGIVMGVFSACWLPFFLVYLVSAFWPSWQLAYQYQSGITWLGYSNSAFNPCIYALLNRDFRASFQRVLGIRCPARHSHPTQGSHVPSGLG